MTFSNRTYAVLKQFALIWLPAVATTWTIIAGIWNLPDTKEIVGSISAIDGLLGTVLHLSSKSYAPAADGALVVDTSDPAKDTYSLELTTPLDKLDSKSSIVLKVTPAK